MTWRCVIGPTFPRATASWASSCCS